MMTFGIDYGSGEKNKRPFFKSTYNVGCRFAILRGSFGQYRDSTLSRDRKACREGGLAFGAYMFLRCPTAKKPVPTPEQQVQTFVDNLGPLLPGDLPPTLDVEFPGKGGRSATTLSVRQAILWYERAYTALRTVYPTVMIYTSARVWREDLEGIVSPLLAGAPLWIKTGYYWKLGRPWDTVHFSPIGELPVPWRTGGSPGTWFHQIQGNATGMPGITRTVDVNLFLEMQLGERSERVKWVQRKLGATADGSFGPLTDAALRAYQTKHGLEVSGIVRVDTFASLCA